MSTVLSRLLDANPRLRAVIELQDPHHKRIVVYCGDATVGASIRKGCEEAWSSRVEIKSWEDLKKDPPKSAEVFSGTLWDLRKGGSVLVYEV